MRSGASVALLLMVAGHACAQGPALGTEVSEEETLAWSITVFPDGRGLPSGSGDARQGASIYAKRCAACHGANGHEGPAARLAAGVATSSGGARTVIGTWAYATSLFDYIRRAMPPSDTKRLTNDEVYALTAFVLFLNGLFPGEKTLDADAIVAVAMPARRRSVDFSRSRH